MARVQLGRPSAAEVFHVTNFVVPMNGFSEVMSWTCGGARMNSRRAVSSFHTDSVVVLAEREVWVAQDDGSVIALLVLLGDWVDQLHVEPDWTGKGVGSRLLGLAKARRRHGLQLWTFQGNTAARRFYARNGFVARDTTEGENEEKAPDVRYEWPGELDGAIP